VRRRAVKSLGIVAVPDEWSIMLALYCSRIVALSACLAGIDYAVCPHVMQVLSDGLKTYARALGTYVSSCTGRTDRLIFMLEVRGPQ
jgi:hypothetical protein